jgi:hypothetical protein
VKTGKSNDRNSQKGTKRHEDNGAKIGTSENILSTEQSIAEGKSKNANHMKRKEDQKKEKVTIISPSNTIVDPRTVMIKTINASVIF